MKRSIVASLALLAAFTLVGLSSASAAEELWIIKDGVLDRGALSPTTSDDYCTGKTVDGLHVSGRDNLARFTAGKSALGDCELKVVFSCAAGRPKWRFPCITIMDRGSLCFFNIFWHTLSCREIRNGQSSLMSEIHQRSHIEILIQLGEQKSVYGHPCIVTHHLL